MERTTFLVLTGFVGLYIAVRAWLLPMTHDEAATCFNHVPRLVVDTLTFQKEANPNNHILNTLLIKMFVGLFGWNQLTARIPALIGGFLYLWASNRLARRISTHGGVRIFALLLLLGNPFLLEFFALARGYGLAAGLLLAAVYQASLFAEWNEQRYVLRAVVFAGLAVYANFTLLLFFAPFVALLFFLSAQANRGWKAFWETNRPALKALGIFILLWIVPLQRLSKDSEIVNWVQMPSFFITVKQLVQSAIANNPYLGENTVTTLAWCLVVGVLAGWVLAIAHWRSQGWQWAKAPGAWMAALLAGAVVANFMQVWLTKTPFLQARLSLFYYPLTALLLAWMGQWLWARFGKMAWVYMAPVLFLLLLNNIRVLNLQVAHEWWYDRSTFNVLDYFKQLHEKENPAEPYILDMNWIMLNSFGFHLELAQPEFARYVRKHEGWHRDQPARPDAGYEFYYATGTEDAQPLLNNFDIVYRAPNLGFLLLRKRK